MTRIGREGGGISDAEAGVVAVHGGAIRKALDNVQGIEEKTVIDTTNLLGVSLSKGFSLKPIEPLKPVERGNGQQARRLVVEKEALILSMSAKLLGCDLWR